MRRINSLDDLLVEELADLLNAENQLVGALPKMAEASQSPALKSALEEQLEISREHINRLKDIFSNIGQNPPRVTCKAMKEFITEGENVVNKAEKSPECDAAIISVAQRVERYEVAEYLTAYEHTMTLGYTWIMELLYTTLNEERAMHFHLNELAQGMINTQALKDRKKETIYDN